ncbi:MAG: translation initiation factor, partial [Synergistaceae bacterium]|nr:translation initiation factor [Synergistaceae bacterium]
VPCGVPLGKDTKPPKTNDQQKTDIKKMIPKFGKISLQHQRAGRGGRTVTLVSISGEPVQNLEAFLKELKKSLGCGGQIEDGRIVLQGEIADRAAEWFIKMGAKSVINAQKK